MNDDDKYNNNNNNNNVTSVLTFRSNNKISEKENYDTQQNTS